MIETPLLQWVNTPSAKGPVAQVGCNFSADQNARVQLKGGILQNTVTPKLVTVNNTTNIANVTLTINGVQQLASGASRVNMPIPDGTTFIDATATGGVTSLIFYADPSDAPPDQPNYLALIGADTAAPVNTGTIVMYGGTVAPSGWLLCDGTAVSRGTFSQLFSVVGVSFGAGDGVSTFNVPDLRDRVPLGASPGGLGGTRPAVRALGGTGGSESHTITVAEMPSHNHGVNDPSHRHEPIGRIDVPGGGLGTAASTPPNFAPTDVPTDFAFTGITIQNTGGGNAIDTTPNFQAVNYIIKT